MTTRVQTELHYDATPDQVAAMILDPAYREHLCERQESTSHRVAVSGSGTDGRVVVDQSQQVRGVPSVVTRIVGSEISIHTEEEWSDTGADVTMTIPGHPGRIVGTTRLLPDGHGTRQVIDWQVKVDIPLVGRKVESVIADVLGKALEVEQQVGRAWLETGPSVAG